MIIVSRLVELQMRPGQTKAEMSFDCSPGLHYLE